MKNFFKVVFSRAVFTGAFIALQFAAVYLAITRFNEHFAIFYGICLVLSAVVVVYLVSRDGNPAYKIAWIIPIRAALSRIGEKPALAEGKGADVIRGRAV